ncbi:tetratricopeptide repeat protein [Actimicrobium sp. CCI2.3]|uniref:tetratricopeptide repeat protein n=1 Tax=Actimicrobium sp. CCI2.3 TaxID=3048616 RepID=UPI002AB434E8|nr:tetratricopeptide repeat protein [Actimicrobium sp. CCI2.3]MDY7574178.1 tetratricopeptide repeat protein [Actimicrobium sp. CCI2.3]MEB0024008.1 tetratricopeptide repeat protein [Actimicrobium sp. CCI2.3]
MKKITEAVARAKQHLEFGGSAEAKRILAGIDRKHPAQITVISLLGVIAGNEGNYDACAKYFERATRLHPEIVENWYYQGMACQKMQRHAEAISAFSRALQLQPDFFEALHDRANSLRETGLFLESITDFNRAIALDASQFQAFYNRGITYGLMKRYDDEASDYHAALSLNPQSIETLINLSVAYSLLSDHDKSFEYVSKALEKDSRNVAALVIRGELFFDRNIVDKAVDDYRLALSINPNHPAALANIAALFEYLKKPDEAIASLTHLLKYEPGYPFALGRLAHLEAMSCNWVKVEQLVPVIQRRLLLREKVISPFFLLGMVDQPESHLLAAQLQLAESFPPRPALVTISPYLHQRPRIAYVSSDFHAHATSTLMVGLLEEHDRARYDIFAISYGPDDGSAMRQRVRDSVDTFVDVAGKSDKEIARIIKDLEIDIAIDLKGFTTGSKLGIFSYRPAAIQVSYLGYPGTTAAPYIDFLLADSIVVTDENRPYFSEKIAYLPHSYQPNDRQRPIPELSLTRAHYHLPEDGIVFASFNNSYKIARATFSMWLDLLRRVPRSVLWLLKTSDSQQQHLIDSAVAAGLDGSRIVFAARVGSDENLSRLRLADIYLDNLPYNAHTTASDALWAGVPIFTTPGVSFASRVATSLLHALDIPELVFANSDALQLAVIEHATSPEKLAALKQKLAGKKLSSPLFDTALYARHIERAFDEMLRQQKSGTTFSDFHVAID